MKVVITKDTSGGKKMKAIFYDGEKKVKTTRFGQAGASDRTRGATDEQQKAYIARHRKDNLSDKFSAGSLSMFVLWSSKSLSQGIKNFKRRFNLK
tara:strand:+ start:1011 stop:1295 length:285 start_codon:yes stop_codon:yes gene_type:complete